MTPRSRLAPTPSGYLHAGNAVNFLLTWLLVRGAGGSLRLRIDDADSERTRPEFVADIFSQLDWLGLDWDEGPSGPDDFYRHHSQLLRLDHYRQLLARLFQRAHLFTCGCSRRQIQAAQTHPGLYPGTCREARHLLPQQAVRIHVPLPTVIEVEGEAIPLCQAMGDFVLWRRNDLPAYQLASLADDVLHSISLIVRGRDLMDSTAAQLFLADQLGEEGFSQTAFVHHPLLLGEAGQKLSKSHASLSLNAMRAAGASPTEIYRLLAPFLGVHPEEIVHLDDLLAISRQFGLVPHPPAATPHNVARRKTHNASDQPEIPLVPARKGSIR